MVEVKLDRQIFVAHGDRIYIRFTPEGDKIKVLRLCLVTGFSLEARENIYSSEIDLMNLTNKYSKEITEQEFYDKIHEQLELNVTL